MSSEDINDDNPRSIQNLFTKDDVAGAFLNGRNPGHLTVPQLKRWLQCRGASTKGTKGDLVARPVLSELITTWLSISFFLYSKILCRKWMGR